MKKLVFSLIAFLLPVAAGAEKVKIDNIYYNLSETEAEVTYEKAVEFLGYTYGKSNYSGIINIPSEIIYKKKKYSVTNISKQAFYSCNITSISIPNSIVSIGEMAFSNTGIKDVTIPNTVTTIGESAFRDCKNLTTVTILSDVTDIGGDAFRECANLTTVTIKGNVTTIGRTSFYKCSNLVSVHINGECKKIETAAFENCSSLTSISLSDSLKYIGPRAFQDCKRLTTINTGSVTTIKEETFINCSSLSSVIISNSVKRIGEKAFDGCHSLKSINIPNGVTHIGDYAFYSSGLTSITLPESVKYIGSEAFMFTEITSVSIPIGVTKIGFYVFNCCRKLTSVNIPNGVTSIGTGAFNNCSSLSSITIPNSVTSIGKEAFKGCKITSITIPSSIKSIDASAFDENVKIIRGEPDDKPLIASNQPVKASDIPNLNVVAGSISFKDEAGANAVVAGKNSRIVFKVKNTGKGAARQCKAKVTTKGTTQGITVKDIAIGSIAAGETKTIELPITAGMNTQDGQVELAIQVDEPNGFGTDPQYITVQTRAFEAPLVKITDYSLTADGGTTLKKKLPFDLQLMLQNTKHGQADDVTVSIEIPKNVIMIEGKNTEQFALLQGGETKSLVYSLIVNNNYAANTIPVKVHVREKHGKYAEDRTIDLALDQAMASTKIAVEASRQQPKGDVTIARLGSDVDKDLPKAVSQQQKTFAVIIANEHYKTVEAVPFAANDGKMFEAYCRQTLGIPQKNIRTVTDATLNDMKFQIDWLRKVMQSFNGEARAIVYYAGHGIPDEQSHSSFLLPVDGYVGSTSSAYSLDELYKTLGSLPARSVTVFLDACFSGTRRDGKMLASARGVAIKAKACTPQGSMVVFSAAQGDETAYPYQDQKHGLFTYYLLKKLKDTKGGATLGDLSDYVTEKVKQQSIVENNKMQTPTVMASPSIGQSWHSMKLLY